MPITATAASSRPKPEGGEHSISCRRALLSASFQWAENRLFILDLHPRESVDARRTAGADASRHFCTHIFSEKFAGHAGVASGRNSAVVFPCRRAIVGGNAAWPALSL